MAIVVPDQGQVGLSPERGSRIIPADTYAPAAVPKGLSQGAADLASALDSLGANLLGINSKQKADQEAADMRNIEHLSAVSKDIQNGGPVAAQSDPALANKSPTVMARVNENLGYKAGETWIRQKLDAIHSNIDISKDPAKLREALDGLYKEAYEANKSNPSYSQGFLTAVRGHNDQFTSKTYEERSKWLQENQIQQMNRDLGPRTEAAASQGIQGGNVREAKPENFPLLGSFFKAGGKNDSHFHGISSDFAQRMEKMLADAPPEIRAKLSAMSGYRSVEHQGTLWQKALKTYGDPAIARKWVAPPGNSQHNHGQAIDFTGGRNFHKTPEGQWVHANAAKYGLHFPMGHEPWHIEPIGARGKQREVAGAELGNIGTNTTGGAFVPRVAPGRRSDGRDTVSDSDYRLMKIIGNESSGNPTAQNPNSSAAGLAGYTESTWLERVKRHRPDAVVGMTDEQIAGLRNSPDPKAQALVKDVASRDIKDYEKQLNDKGLPNTNANIYLLHFGGPTGGEKVIRAQAGTPVKELLSAKAIQSNPFLATMTAGQLREWAADKMGDGVSANSRARNAVRATDREYAQSSSLPGEIRRQAASGYLYDMAVKTGDAKYLDWMPPELMTPEVGAKFAQARKLIEENDHKRKQWAYQEKQREDKEVEQRLITEGYQKIVKGGDINLVEASTDPRTGQVDPQVYDKLKTARDNHMFDPVKSQSNALTLGRNIENNAATGDWTKMFPHIPKGQDPSIQEVQEHIQNAPDIRPEDKIAMMKDIQGKMDKYTILRGPEFNELFSQNVQPAIDEANKGFMVKLQTQMGGMQGTATIALGVTIREAFQFELRRRWKAHIEETGQAPSGNAKIQIQDAAVKFAQNRLLTEVQRLSDPKQANIPPKIEGGSILTTNGQAVVVPPQAAKPAANTPAQPAAQQPAQPSANAPATPAANQPGVDAKPPTPTESTPKAQPVDTRGMTPAQKSEALRNEARKDIPETHIMRTIQNWAKGADRSISSFFKRAAEDISNGVTERKVNDHVNLYIKQTPELKAEFDGFEKRMMKAKSKKEELQIGTELAERYDAIRAEFLSKNDITKLPALHLR